MSTTHSPVRIYVLWHPDFDRPDLKELPPDSLSPADRGRIDAGRLLARRIYHWFRLENMEGIPVYFRSTNATDKHQPLPIADVDGTNYIVPLINADMVASPTWRGYVMSLVNGQERKPECRDVVLPVAVDPVAYNMPAGLRRLNFLRHDMTGDVLPDPEALLSSLTEIICRDLRGHLQMELHPEHAPGGIPVKLKVFLSHAKADGTSEALALKDFLYRKTQCEAFFDETDIASGYDFGSILGDAVEMESAGLFVIHGDHYADRPWCRKEIRDFLKPVPDSAAEKVPAFFVPPVVVVQTMKGNRVARSIPELGHAPCVRWKDEKSARFLITTLLREILLGLFYRLIARDLARGFPGRERVFINRTPDPVMVDRILATFAPGERPETFVHPGYGLSAMDRMCLGVAFPGLKFTSFSELADSGRMPLPDLTDKVISVSAGNSPDILRGGAADEHNRELLRRLLRPLFRAGASILYGGALPTADPSAKPWKDQVNFVASFLELLLSERDAADGGEVSRARLYNLAAWPFSEQITSRVRAQWTDICSFIPLGASHAELGEPPEIPPKPADAELAELPLAERNAARKAHREAVAEATAKRKLIEARCLSVMRKMAALKERIGPVPPDASDGLHPPPSFKTTLAHVFLGGKIRGAAGVMPGLFEEVLHAFEHRKPVFMLRAGHGAAGLLARWLADPALESPPPELTPDFYMADPAFAEIRRRMAELREATDWNAGIFLTPDEGFDRLWTQVRRARSEGLAAVMANGLTDEENSDLLQSKDYGVICDLVWRGIARLAAPPDAAGETPAVTAPQRAG